MWADVEVGRRRGGGAEGGRDSSPSLGRRVPSAGGFIYAAKQSSPPPSRAQRLQGLSARTGGRQEPSLLAKSRGASASHVTRGGEGGAKSYPLGAPLQLLPTPSPPPPRSLLHPRGRCQKRRWPTGDAGQGRNTLVRTARDTCHSNAAQQGAS